MRALTLLALCSTIASAAPLRLAVVYGHNGGEGARAPLRYAELDAARVAQVLQETGGVEAQDVKLLQGRPVSDLFAALDWAKGRARGGDTLLFVYVSAHADAQRGLLPGAEQLEWKALKDRVAATGAKARVTIVDACQSSGVLEAGARAAPVFTIEAEDALTVKGDAFITSSASNEPSLEAGVYRGSVFTQHLLAALRGAGDRSGDGKISLEEAYRFAFERTQEGESGQHPGFATRLSGYGELQVARVEARSGVLVPDGVEAISVRDAKSGEKLVSARRPESKRLAVPPGEWIIEVEQSADTREGRITVPRGEFVSVDTNRLGSIVRQARLVRLEGGAPACVSVRAARPDPALEAARKRLAAELPGACEAAIPLVLEHAASKLRLRAELRGEQAFVAEGDAPQLIDATRRWLAAQVANKNP